MNKKIFVLASLLIFVSSFCYAQRSFHTVKTSTGESVILINATEVVRSHSIKINQKLSDNIGVFYKATGSTIDMKISFQQSFSAPDTEGAFSAQFLTTDTVDAGVTDAIWHLATITSVVAPRVRILVQGQGSNSTNTSILIRVVK